MCDEGPKNKKYVMVAPDGGWGYVIILAVIINLICISTFGPCFGMIFKEWIIHLDMDTKSIMLFNGINASCAAITGFITAPMLKYISTRKLGLIAALVFNFGVFGTVFVQSKLQFFITQGIMQFIGNGIIFNLSFSMLNSYFEKRRFMVVTVTQTITAICSFFTPHLIKWALETYGLRGTLLLISAISIHSIFAMILMQPVSWHLKRVAVPGDKENDFLETKSLLVNDTIYITNEEDLTDSIKSHKLDFAADIKSENYKSHEETLEDGNKGTNKFLFGCIDRSLLKSFLLSNASIGVALSLFSEMTFILMLPQALYYMGWNENYVAWALSLNALGDLLTRCLFILFGNALAKVGSHKIYVVGLLIAVLTRIAMLCSDNRSIIVTSITIMGISRCTIMILLPIVVADSVGQQQFTSALGLLLLSVGFFNLTLGPIIGAVRDLTDSYATVFYILTSFYAIVAMSWSIEIFYKNNKHKATQIR